MRRSITVFFLGAMNPTSVGPRFWPLLDYLTSRGDRLTVVVPALTARLVRQKYARVEVVALWQPLTTLTRLNFVINCAAALVHAFFLRFNSDVCLAMTGAVHDLLASHWSARRSTALSAAYIDNMTLRRRPERTWWTLLDRVAGLFAERIYQKLDILLAGTASIGKALEEIGVTRRRIYVTGYGVGEGFEAAKERGVARSRYRAVFIGRFTKAKGVFDLIQAWPQIIDAVPAASLHVMGAGDVDTVSYLKDVAAASGGSINFLGFVGEEQKFRELLEAEVMIFPTYSESYGQVVAEALISGVRVVAYDIEGFRDNFPGLIDVGPVGDVNSLVTRSVAALKNEAPSRSFERALRWSDLFSKEQDAISEALS